MTFPEAEFPLELFAFTPCGAIVVGMSVVEAEGNSVGISLGRQDGIPDGNSVGIFEGKLVEGTIVGIFVGIGEGFSLGTIDGMNEGFSEGTVDGSVVGFIVGSMDG
jgi:hypothetical protein